MEKIETFEKKLYNQLINYYQFSKKISLLDIYSIVDVLNSNGIQLSEFRLSNSEDSPEHFFRLFSSLKDFNTFAIPESVYVDDFGVDCIYSGVKFSLTFDLSQNQVITFVKMSDNINLEPLLMQIEDMCQKKTR